MKITIQTEDKKELARIQKSLDMALFIFELARNSCKNVECKCYSNPDSEPIYIFFEHINELLDKHNINIDELLD